jgi:GST-like protein
MIDLYGCGSPNVFKVLLMLAETELPYCMHSVGVHSAEQFTPTFRGLNPNSKVPVIVDRDGPAGQRHVVFESGAILIYLAEKTGRLLPTDPVARSRTLQWLMFQIASIGPMFGQALHFQYLAPPGNDYACQRYHIETERLYAVLEHRLSETRYLAGDEYTIADIAAFPWIARYPRTLGVDMTRLPAVRDWIDRIEARPAQQFIAPLCKQLFKAGLAAQASASAQALDRFFGRVPAGN